MSKKQKTQIPTKKATISGPITSKKEVNKPKGIGFFRNFILFLFSIVLVLVLFKGNEGYSWVLSDLINANLKFINSNRHLTPAQKYQSKFGVDAAAIDFIKNQTPEDAVILIPPHSVLMNDSSEYKFMKGLGGIKARTWTLYFLYPRKLVYFDESDKNKFAKDVTHVVCLNGWGYDKLLYATTPKSSFEILPVKEKTILP